MVMGGVGLESKGLTRNHNVIVFSRNNFVGVVCFY